MGSVFMPPHFVLIESTETDIKIASIAWGWQLGFTVLTAAKAGAQALRIWRRTHRITGYVMMVWAEILANVVWGVLTWLYLNEIIPPSFALFFIIVILWCIELHCLIQIIVNRLSLLLYSDGQKFWIKWGAFAYISFLNISVFIIWIPAQLQHQPWHDINLIWDRIEKCLFLIIDVGLNIFFVYLVKTKLIASGVTKYWPLFRFNVCMIFISVSMDILIIGMMSMRNPLMYMQFHPVAYMIKLNIEMSMASLIGKIARSHDNSTFSYSEPRSTPSRGADVGGGDAGISSSGCSGGWLFPARNKKEEEAHGAHGSIGMEDFNPISSAIADYPCERYHAWVSTGPPTPPRERLSLSERLSPKRIGGSRRSNSDETIVFAGINKDTEVTVVSEMVPGEQLTPMSSPQRLGP